MKQILQTGSQCPEEKKQWNMLEGNGMGRQNYFRTEQEDSSEEVILELKTGRGAK